MGNSSTFGGYIYKFTACNPMGEEVTRFAISPSIEGLIADLRLEGILPDDEWSVVECVRVLDDDGTPVWFEEVWQ